MKNKSFGNRINNRQAVIDLLLAHGSLSRVELARAIHLSKPTISSVIAELLAEDVICEVGLGASRGGRKPILLRLGGERKLVAGVEIDPKACQVALVNLDGQVLQQVELPLPDTRVETIVSVIVGGIRTVFAGRGTGALLGCGVAVPGVVDPAGAIVSYAASLEWGDVPLKRLIEEQLQVPVHLTDRGKAAALGELWFRGREKSQDLIFIYLGTGVGGGIILGNSLHMGVSHLAGEIGHMTIAPDGPLCKCGNRGCLETFISGPAIAMRTRALIQSGRESILTGWIGGKSLEAITTKMISEAAAAGDPLALEVLQQTIAYLGTAIAHLSVILNPETIVLGGPVSHWGELLVEGVRQEVRKRTSPILYNTVQIVNSAAGDVAVPLGAAALVLSQASDLLAMPGGEPAAAT